MAPGTDRNRPAGDAELESEVRRAQQGDRTALEGVVRAIQPRIHSLALRFLWHPADAADATQEILIRIITNLGGFRGRSRFTSWAYRVAVNKLLSMQPSEVERREVRLEEFGEDLQRGLSQAPRAAAPDPEEAVLLEEVKIGCTHAMLQCLDRGHRLAFILGEILELEHREAAAVLNLNPATYRKRLSRARRRLTDFLQDNCGLFEPENTCRCWKRLPRAVELGRVDPGRLLFAHDPQPARRFPEALAAVRQLEGIRRTAALYRSNAEPQASSDLVLRLRRLLESV